MTIPFQQLKQTFKRILLNLSFPENKAELCAHIFASNSRDGVYSHGLNRFPTFVQHVQQNRTDPFAEPSFAVGKGCIENYDGHLAPGMYNATICMDRAISLAKQHGIGWVNIYNTNHWMRGGTYGWQAAEAGCIGICFTNAIAGMPAWGGTKPTLGNNPLVIAVPRKEGHIVLDMAMSHYSYGKLQEYELKNEKLPFAGGYDEEGNLTTDASAIRRTKRALPIGYWKGSGLAMMLDILLVAMSGGRSTASITAQGFEFGLSQCFIALHRPDLHASLIEEIIAFSKSGPHQPGEDIHYPGERTLKTRLKNEQEGVPVDPGIWEKVQAM